MSKKCPAVEYSDRELFLSAVSFLADMLMKFNFLFYFFGLRNL